jgi:two-component system sporulation sensor kinase A
MCYNRWANPAKGSELGNEMPESGKHEMEQAALLDALQASEERFRLAADFAYDWVYWEGPDGRFVYVSPSCARITGYSADEFIQDPQLFIRLVHPDDREILDRHRNEERNHPGTHGLNYRIVRRDGRERWIGHVCQRLHDASGTWLGWRGSNRDITEQVLAEQALALANEELAVATEQLRAQNEELLAARRDMESQHQRYQELFDLAPDGYLVTNLEGIVQEANHVAAALLGTDKAALVGEPLDHYLSPADRPSYHNYLAQLGRDGPVETLQWETSWEPHDGEPFHAHLSVAVGRDPDGKRESLRWLIRDVTEHKQADDALRESEAKLQALFAILPVGISILDAERRIRYTNPALSRILDLPAEDLARGRHQQRTYLKADGSPMAPDEFPSVRAFREQRTVRDVEVGIVKEDGAVIWTNVSAVPLPFADWSVITVTADVTEKVQARRQVEEHAALLDTMLTSLAESVILYDPDTRILRANPAARNLFPFPAGEDRSTLAEHMAWSTPIQENGEAIPLDEAPAMRALRGETVNGVVMGLQIGPGPRVWLSASAAPVCGPDGALMGALVSLVDITELRRAREELEQRVQERTAELWTSNQALQSEILVRRQAEADLRESELRFRQLAENVDEVFCLWEAETRRALYVSPSYEVLWGRPVAEVYRSVEAALEGVHSEDRERVRAIWEDSSQNHDAEFRVLRPDGSVRWVRGRTFVVEGEDGMAPRIAAIASDITGQKEAQATVIRADRLKTSVQLAASLAHEINNPLQSAIGCLDLAIESMDNGRDPRRYFDIVSQALEQAAAVVGQLRSLHGQLGVEERYPVDLGNMLERVVALTQQKWQSQDVSVILNLDPDLPSIALQADAMHQVFLNMVHNALDAMPDGGELRIDAERSYEPGGVWIRIADTGTGLSAEVREHLFEPLHSTKSEGLGLGLFISQNIVHQHSGRIEFESQEGQGTVFSIWLPS